MPNIFGLILTCVIVVIVFSLLLFLIKRYKKCPSDKVMVIYGKVGSNKDGSTRSAKCIHGGAAFIWPVIQSYEFLDLTPMSISVDLENALSRQNIRINVPSRFTVGVSTEPGVMQNAAERLLGLKLQEIQELAKDIIFGQLRLVIATMDIEEINTDRDKFLEAVSRNVEGELKKIGLRLINVNVTDISDESGYIDALGKEAAAKAINDAKKNVAEKDRDGSIGERSLAFYERLARGGVSYIVIGDVAPVMTASPTPKLATDAQIPTFKALADAGVKELIVIAQDITRYGIDLYHKRMLGELLTELIMNGLSGRPGQEGEGVPRFDPERAPWLVYIAKGMKWVDPGISLIACGYEQSADWNYTVAKEIGSLIDYISAHHYSVGWGPFQKDDYLGCLYIPEYMNRLTNLTLSAVNAGLNDVTDHIKVAWDEWNLFGWIFNGVDDDASYTMQDVITTALVLNFFIQNSDKIGMANYSTFVNINGAVSTHDDQMVKRAQFYVFDLIGNHTGSQAVEVYEEGEAMDIKVSQSKKIGRPDLGIDLTKTDDTVEEKWVKVNAVDCAATIDESGMLYLSLINKLPDRDADVVIDLDGWKEFEVACSAEIYHDDLSACNTLEHPDTVSIREGAQPMVSGNRLEVTLKKHSVNLIQLQKK